MRTRVSVLFEQLLAGCSLISFAQSETGSYFAIPTNPLPKSFAVPAHDLELCDRALVPVLDIGIGTAIDARFRGVVEGFAGVYGNELRMGIA